MYLKNLITRALGVDETVEIEIEEMIVQPGDIYLLCTDGLSDMVSDADIHSTLHKEP
jgi:PPM family protein phosphatase